MKRTPLRRTARLEPGKPMQRGPGPQRGKPLRKRNHARYQRLRAQQFGTDGYREHVLSLPCVVTGCWPVDPAHVIQTRAAGGGPEGMGPLRSDVHTAFDSMGEDAFQRMWGVSKDEVRRRVARVRADWVARAGGADG